MSIFGDHKDLDSVLVSFLDIDDLRNLYQVNKYYHDLICPTLKDYITAFANNPINSLLKAMHTNNINVVKYFFDNYASNINNYRCWKDVAYNNYADIQGNILDYVESKRELPYFDVPSNRFASEGCDRACIMYGILVNSCARCGRSPFSECILMHSETTSFWDISLDISQN